MARVKRDERGREEKDEREWDGRGGTEKEGREKRFMLSTHLY